MTLKSDHATPGPSLGLELAVAAVLALTCAFVAGWLNLHEALFSISRRWETLQVDEWPLAALVFALCATWIAWRRYRQAWRELLARQQAERRLAAVLAQNRELAQQHLQIQEAERKHLARELHDELGQYLNAIKLDAVTLTASPTTDAGAVHKSAAHIVTTVDHLHGVVSDMIRRLRPAGLDELGLQAALESCVDHWRGRLPQTRFALSCSGGLDDLGEAMNLGIYRLIQEGLTNAHKHAAAKRVDISLRRSDASDADGSVELLISDDGRGMNDNAAIGGYGIRGMRERVEMLGGRFAIESLPGRGTTIHVTLPLQGGPA
jgi:signal transduction histidine kinase